MITLKYLRDLYESEKRSLKLQPLNSDFFKEVEAYFELKRKIASKSNLKSYQIMKEVENFRMLLRMLLEKREQKLISLAMRHIRSGIKVDKRLMLPSEVVFFDKLVELIKENEIRLNKLLQEENIFEHLHEQHSLTSVEQIPEESASSNSQKTQEDQLIPTSTNESMKEQKPSLVKLKVVEHVPSFLGDNLEFLGPYEPEEIVFLPPKIAEILIKLGKAKKADSP